jgi:hypothetical protein
LKQIFNTIKLCRREGKLYSGGVYWGFDGNSRGSESRSYVELLRYRDTPSSALMRVPVWRFSSIEQVLAKQILKNEIKLNVNDNLPSLFSVCFFHSKHIG